MSSAVSLYYEEHGASVDHRSLLLIAGYGAHLTDWPPELLDQFIARGFHVVTVDNRDVGRSPHFTSSGVPELPAVHAGLVSPPYSLDDMADDVVQLIKQLELDRPVVLSHSMGTMIAQLIAIRAPQCVSGLVMVATTTGSRSVGQPRADIAAEFAAERTSFSDIEDPFERAVALSSRWASWGMGVTEDRLRDRLRKRFDRETDFGGARRQFAAILAASDRTESLREVVLPAVVIHGTDDPLLDVSGGRAVAAAMPRADLIVVDKLAHDLPEALWPVLIEAVETVDGISRGK